MTAPTLQPTMDPTASGTEAGGLQHVPCDLCGTDQPVVLFEQRGILFGYEEPAFRIVRCAVCDLIYLSPRPTPQAIGRHYPRAYYELQRRPKTRGRFGAWIRRVKAAIRSGVLREFYGYGDSAGEDSPGVWSAWTPLWKALLYGEHLRLKLRGKAAIILPFVGDGMLLDVGCGSGERLQRHVALGWDGWGVEISPEAARYAREERGLRVFQGDLPGAGFPAGTFDMVVFSHSLEHMFSPTATLREVNRILRPGGRLFLALPNAASAEARLFGRWWFGWEVPRHLYHFTPRTLDRCLRQTGFRVIRMGWDPGTMTFLESLKYVWKYRRGKDLPRVRAISWLAGLPTFWLGHLRLGPIMFVHAERVEGIPAGQAEHLRGTRG